MEAEKVVLGDRKVSVLDLDDPETLTLIQYAQESNEADHQLSVRQALKRYKKAVFWAMILSTTLVMEGYDLVIVSAGFQLGKKGDGVADILKTDQLLLRPIAVFDPVWCLRRGSIEVCHHRSMAVRLVQLGSRRSAGWPCNQRMGPRPVRCSTNSDVFPCMDGIDDLHPCFCTLTACIGLRRGHVWCFMGSFPGKLQ
jgi:hypothetical protein